MEPLGGIAEADARLGRRFPLPALPLPLARWVEIRAIGRGAEVEWNLDDTRPGSPGRLALYAGPEAPPDQLGPQAEVAGGGELVVRRAPLDEADEPLKPVIEVAWQQDGLQLRLTAQGPWALRDVLALVRSVQGASG